MATETGSQLAKDIRQNVATLKVICQGIDEGTASQAPSGRWSPKEILSHLCGAEGPGYKEFLQAFLDQDTPTLNINPENPFYSETRAAMTVEQLLSVIEERYEGMAEFALGLSEEQLARTARIPQLKDSPLGEYPTLESLLGGLGRYHLQFHTDHLREVLQELAVQKIV